MSSAIKVPKVKVSSIHYPIFDFEYNAGLDSSPSEINISFVSKDGQYKEPELSLTSPTTIELGNNILFNYFPVESSIRRNPRGGNILNVNFVDGSYILDKVWVGLKNKHGDESSFPILIVGDEVHPCSGEDEVKNPCDPCADDSLVDCLKQAEERILDVRYNFVDLLNELENFEPSIEIENRPPDESFNLDFFNKYTGALRDVLRSWCDDYGMSFYWTNDNKIKFIDLRAGFKINTKGLTSQKEVISKGTVRSIKDTSCNGIIAHYGQDRQQLSFNCNNSQYIKLLLKPVNLKDITDDNSVKAYDGLKFVEKCMMTTYYSPAIRDLLLIEDVYDLNSPSKLRSKQDQVLPLLGNMKIKKVLSNDSPDSTDKKLFHLYFQLLMGQSDSGNPVVSTEDSIYNDDFSIVIVDQDDNLKEKFVTFERDLASSFYGKFYMRHYGPSAKNINWSAPSGAVNHYSANHDYTNELPFLRLLEDYIGIRDSLAPGSNLFSRSENGQVQTDDSFLLLERESPWNPSQNSTSIQKIVEEANSVLPKEIPKFSISNLKSLLGTENSKVYLFKHNTSNIRFLFGEGENALDKEKKRLRFESGNVGEVWGLRDNRCVTLKIQIGSATVNIEGPSQATAFTPLTKEGGYMIIGNSNGTNLKRTIPKKELTKLKLGSEDENYLGCENTIRTSIVVKEIKEELTNVLDDFCSPSDELIESLIDSYLEKLHYTIDQPYRKEEYSLIGLPDDVFSPEDGMTSFKASLDDSSGWVSDLTFETVKKKQLETDLIIKNFESYVDQYLRGSSSNSFESSSQSEIGED